MKRRTWTRTGLPVMLLLTGGAIVNVAVAWACSVWVPLGSIKAFGVDADFDPINPSATTMGSGFGFHIEAWGHTNNQTGSWRCGWPAWSMLSKYIVSIDDVPATLGIDISRSAIRLPGWIKTDYDERRFVPY